MEHYSTFDIPCFYELLEHGNEEMRSVADSIVSVAGVQLNETSKLVLAFTEVFTRVVLYPARSFKRIKDPRELREAEKRRARINIAAMKMLNSLRKQGRLIYHLATRDAVSAMGPLHGPWPSGDRHVPEVLLVHGHDRGEWQLPASEPQ